MSTFKTLQITVTRLLMFSLLCFMVAIVTVATLAFQVEAGPAVTVAALSTALLGGAAWVLDRLPGTTGAAPGARPDNRRAADHTVGPDGQPLLMGQALEPKPEPEGAIGRPEDALTLILKGVVFTTPLWGRKPAAAFRDLHAYARLAELLRLR